MQQIIEHCIEDMTALIELIQTEQNKQPTQIYVYQLALNREIIKNLIKGDLVMATSLIQELKRSIIASTEWMLQEGMLNDRQN